LRLAWMALLADAASSHTLLDQKTATGFTPKQELFLGWGQNWCASERSEYLRLAVQVDVHSPDRIRANGVVVNMPEFSEAFGCKKGQLMSPAPEKMCRVW
ncbi:MAG TPA: M13-type metalloendopeptidase, partial [Acidobacteriaceae bacterium]